MLLFSYDAMTGRRLYREGIIGKEEALQELKDNSEEQFDPEVMGMFLKSVI